jgi:hypothetical protein
MNDPSNFRFHHYVPHYISAVTCTGSLLKQRPKPKLTTSLQHDRIVRLLVKGKGVAVPVHNYAMKAYGGVDISVRIFFTSALGGGEWSASCPCRFTPGERAHGTHWTGGWVGPRAGLDDMEERKILDLTGTEL